MCPIKASIVGGAEVAFEQLLGFSRIFCRRGSFGQIKPATPTTLFSFLYVGNPYLEFFARYECYPKHGRNKDVSQGHHKDERISSQR
jgi:hypothetical protein